MSKLIYAEPDDEITNLVDRLRSEKTEKELVFVLPGGSRVLHSNLNGRLLKQYSNSLGKSTSVISPDPRTQSIAIEAGFAVFPTMAAFESGRAIDRAVDFGAASQAGVLAALPVESSAFEAVATPRRAAPPPPLVARTRPKPSAAVPEGGGGRGLHPLSSRRGRGAAHRPHPSSLRAADRHRADRHPGAGDRGSADHHGVDDPTRAQ
jgi:hypothetical protein